MSSRTETQIERSWFRNMLYSVTQRFLDDVDIKINGTGSGISKIESR